MVQPELHPENEGREGERDPGQPDANPTSARVSEDLNAATDLVTPAHQALDTVALEPGGVAVPQTDASWDVVPSPVPATVLGPVVAAKTGPSFAQIQEEIVAWVKTLFSAAVYAVLIVTFVFQVARVEGQSMAHTLEDQDRLIVNKLLYRLSDPRRGDIVMLYYPLNPDKSYVKRVIAEEGDSVRIVDGRVYVNDIPLQDDYVSSEYRSHDDYGPTIIPEGYYFVMGDHRNNSSDSRHWGMVPKRYIIGKVQLRWWPSRRLVSSERYAGVARVLLHVLVLNLVVALAKIAFGYRSGAISILSDGFHSLTDAASNVVGLVGVYAARRPPDDDHPYGHRKYETVAAVGVVGFLGLVMLEVLRNAFNHLSGRVTPHDISPAAFFVMVATVGINLLVVRYESSAAERLGSEVLLADATQTRSDVWSSVTVIAALAGARAGMPILDPLAALVVAAFIGYAGYQVALTTTKILSDRIVMSEVDIETVVMGVDGVIGCHHIRTRGTADHVFLDLHVWLPADMRLTDAHDISHVVKDRLMAHYPQIVDAVIHLEPPPRAEGV